MAGLEGYSMYSEDDPENWDLRHQRDSHLRRVRPTELNLQAVSTLDKVEDDSVTEEEEAIIRKYVSVGVGLATIVTENLLSHPFVVLRRQCQVHHNSRKSHLVAITLVPVVLHLHQRQGLTTLWKGLGSTLLVRGMSLVIEDLITKFTPWPKEITWHSSVKSFGQHLLLKCVSLALVTPFYSASLVETVQSDIASEKPGMFDVFKEGMCRLVSWGSPQKGRMLPVWALVVPTVMYGIMKYLFSMVVQNVASRVIHLRQKNCQRKRGALQKDVLSQAAIQDVEVTSAFIGMVSAEVIFYPLETILHRLHLQGTRTIIDNLDTGMEVIPILTSYENANDCYEATIAQEGISGLYKGFGALILQFAAHWTVIKLTKFIVTEITVLMRPSVNKTKIDPTPVPTPQITQKTPMTPRFIDQASASPRYPVDPYLYDNNYVYDRPPSY